MSYVGLTSQEVASRITRFGENTIERRSVVVWWKVLLAQFKSPLIYVLVFATLATIWLGKYTDALIIGIAVVANTLLGFFQEYRAEKSLEALSNLLVPTAKAKRDGEWKEVKLAEIVPGDLVRLEIGQSVPADGVLVVEDGMYINEAILTGESVPVEKKKYVLSEELAPEKFETLGLEHKCFQGTIIEQGIGEMLVVRTGGDTRLGQIAAEVVGKAQQKTPLQEKLNILGKQLAFFVAVVAVVIFVVGILAGGSLEEIFPTAIALAVAAMPEGLLVSLTLILSVGMGRILKKRGLVRRLLAAETLGSVDVICLDKTGTITLGKMSVEGVVTNPNRDIAAQLSDSKNHNKKTYELMVLGTILCNDQRDPLEIAMSQWFKARVSGSLLNRYERIDSLPFAPKYRYIVTRHRDKKTNKVIEYLSGAPETVLAHTNLTTKEKKLWLEKIVRLGKMGYRLIGQSYRLGKQAGKIGRNRLSGFVWLGLVAFVDPVRKGVEVSLKQAASAHIGLKVITGDYQETAWAVLSKLGMVKGELDPDLVVTGDELEAFSKANDGQIGAHIEKSILFARTTPDQKVAIVEALQQHGHVVAMTGDGVNDAPALRQADIGVVVNESSDVAKETADLVLLDNNFATILSAVEEGRAIFANLRRVLLYLMSDAFVAVVLVVATIFLGWPLPILAVQILWINLISDGFPYLALTVEPKDKDLLNQYPTPRDKSIMDRQIIVLMSIVSLVSGLLALAIFHYYHFALGFSLTFARSVVFAAVGFMTLIYVYSVRSLGKNIWQENPLRNPYLVFGTVLGLLIQLAAFGLPQLRSIFNLEPLRIIDWMLVVFVTLFLMLTLEVIKFVLRFSRLTTVSNQVG